MHRTRTDLVRACGYLAIVLLDSGLRVTYCDRRLTGLVTHPSSDGELIGDPRDAGVRFYAHPLPVR